MRRLFRWLFLSTLWFVGLSTAWVLVYTVVPPPTTPTMLFDSHGATRDWMALGTIDRDMPRAVIAAEDSKFCSHSGFDTEAIAEAIERNARGGRMRGGSTISQQVAKNVFLWQGSSTLRRYARKLPEAWFTLLIETIWGKRRIMEVYLNVAETGIGTYGVEAGAQRYFNKSAKNLTRQEAAKIAAALPLPKKRAVINPSGWTRRYGNIITSRIRIVQGSNLDACVVD